MRRPGSLVSPPAVIPGLALVHRASAGLPWSDCWAPAIAAAREGIAVGRDLAVALRWARERHRGLNTAFRATFLPGDAEPTEGQRLIQPDLAQSLQAVAVEAGNALRQGALPQALVATVRATGGVLDHGDLAALDARVGAAGGDRFGSARVYTPDREESGGAILLDALAELAAHPPGPARRRGLRPSDRECARQGVGHAAMPSTRSLRRPAARRPICARRTGTACWSR